jgi:hypothetical protein
MQAEEEPGDYAEVAATPQRPEEVGVLVAAGRPGLAVRGDDLDLLYTSLPDRGGPRRS